MNTVVLLEAIVLMINDQAVMIKAARPLRPREVYAY
jgi:hypothetical protein